MRRFEILLAPPSSAFQRLSRTVFDVVQLLKRGAVTNLKYMYEVYTNLNLQTRNWESVQTELKHLFFLLMSPIPRPTFRFFF